MVIKSIVSIVLVAVCSVLLDVISGVFLSWVRGEFMTSVMREGGRKKLGEIFAIVIGFGMDFALRTFGISNVPSMGYLVCAYLTFMNAMSIVENFDQTYPNLLPKRIKHILADSATELGIEMDDGTEDEDIE